MIFLDDEADTAHYECINQTIPYGNVMTMSLINIEENHGAIDADDYKCHGYYIIIFSSSPYTIQSYVNRDGQVIYSGEMLCEGNYYFPININSN